MGPIYRYKTTFQVKPSIDSDKVMAEYENEVESEDKRDPEALFGEGHAKARDFMKKHGGIIVRKVVCTSEEYAYSDDGSIYLRP